MPGFSLCAVKAALLWSCVGSFRVSLLDWNMIGRDHPKHLVFPLCHSLSQDLSFFFSFSCVPHSAATRTARMLDIPRAGAKYGNLMPARLLLKMFASGVCLQTLYQTLLLVRKEKKKKDRKGLKQKRGARQKSPKSNQIKSCLRSTFSTQNVTQCALHIKNKLHTLLH